MILTVGTDEGLRDRVENAIGGTPWATAVGNVGTAAEARELLRGAAPPRAVVVGQSLGVAGGGDVAAAVAALRNPPLVLLVADPTTEVLRSAMRAGIRDVLPPGFEGDDLIATLRDAGLAGAGPTALPGLTVAVFSTKGGVGTSVVASNLAVLLGERIEIPSVLLDLDLASADQAIMHGLSPKWTIQDIADGAVGADAEALEQVLLPLEGSNSRLLAGPVDPAMSETITSDDVTSVIAAVRAQTPVAVLDTASGFDERTLSALDAADVTVVVSSLDVAALRSLTVSLRTMDRLGIEPSSILVALVRADSKSGLAVADVERAIGRDLDVSVPSTRQVARSVNEGVPLAVSSGRSSVVSALDGLVDRLEGMLPSDVARSKRRGGFFPWSRGSASSTSEPSGESATSGAVGSAQLEQSATTGRTEPAAADGDGDEGSRVVRALPVDRKVDVRDEASTPEESTPEESAPEEGPKIRAVPRLADLPPPEVAAEDDDDDEPRRRRRR